jgi:hypothetical protein
MNTAGDDLWMPIVEAARCLLRNGANADVLQKWIAHGALDARAIVIMKDGERAVEIPLEAWADAQVDWMSGNLVSTDHRHRRAWRKIEAFALEVRRDQLERLFPHQADGSADTGTSSPSASAGREKRGRPSGRNGEPIAHVTIRLMNMEPGEFERHTATAVAEDLIEEYRKLALAPPNLSNAESDAAGILRAVRAARRGM